MKILDVQTAQMCDFEVLEFIKTNKPKVKNQDLKTLQFEMQQYFKEQPANVQNHQQITEFMQKIKKFKLLKAEKLMLLNNCPSNMATLTPLIEESNIRFNQQELQEILDLLTETLPFQRPEPPE